MDESLLEIRGYDGDGYQPLVDYGEWRVAVLNFLEAIRPALNNRFERHTATDEIFVLMHGRGVLLMGGNGPQVGEIVPEVMLPAKVYNVKCNAWHGILLSEDASVLIVENKDTGDHNTEYCDLSAEQRSQIVTIGRQNQIN